MQDLWTFYHSEIPAFLRPYLDTPPLARLREVGMNCGCEYTDFPLYRRTKPYSRFDHSVGAALITWHFHTSYCLRFLLHLFTCLYLHQYLFFLTSISIQLKFS